MRPFIMPASTHAAILKSEAEVLHNLCIMLHHEQMETTECALHAAAKVELILRHQRRIETFRREQKALHREADNADPTLDD